MNFRIVGFDGIWWFEITFGSETRSFGYYSRRRDAVRGFNRFCAAIKKVK